MIDYTLLVSMHLHSKHHFKMKKTVAIMIKTPYV